MQVIRNGQMTVNLNPSYTFSATTAQYNFSESLEQPYAAFADNRLPHQILLDMLHSLFSCFIFFLSFGLFALSDSLVARLSLTILCSEISSPSFRCLTQRYIGDYASLFVDNRCTFPSSTRSVWLRLAIFLTRPFTDHADCDPVPLPHMILLCIYYEKIGCLDANYGTERYLDAQDRLIS